MSDKKGTNTTQSEEARAMEIAEQTRVVQRILEAKRDDLGFQSAVRGLQNQDPSVVPVRRPPRP